MPSTSCVIAASSRATLARASGSVSLALLISRMVILSSSSPHETGTRGVGADDLADDAPRATSSDFNSLSMRANTPCQSPLAVWRNSRMVGYQGQSSRPISQRQSGTCLSASQIGRPSAPARWATPVSELMTRSQLSRIAAVSRKESGPVSKSVPKVSSRMPGGRWASCASPEPFCRLKSRTPGIVDRVRNRASGKERPMSILAVLPCQQMPILKPCGPMRRRHSSTRGRSTAR